MPEGLSDASPILRRPRITGAEWKLLLVLAAIQFTHILDFVIMMPLGPRITRDLGINPQQFGFLVAAYGFAASFASLIASVVLDRLDRKTALLSLYMGLTLCTAACAIAPSYEWLLAARIAAGVFGGVVSVAVMAVVGDVFEDARRGTATGAVMSAFAFASAVGIPLGLMSAEDLGWQAPFAFLAALGSIILAVGWFMIPSMKGHKNAHPHSMGKAFIGLLAEPNHRRAFAFSVSVIAGGFLVIPFLAIFMVRNVGRTESQVKYVYLFAGIATLIGSNVIGRLSDRFGKRFMFRIVGSLSVVMILILSNLPPVSLGIALLVSTGFMVCVSGRWVPGMALVTGSALPAVRGGFLSLNTAIQHVTMAGAAAISGMLVQEDGPGGPLVGYPIAGLISALCGVASLLLVGRMRQASESPKKAPEADECREEELSILTTDLRTVGQQHRLQKPLPESVSKP